MGFINKRNLFTLSRMLITAGLCILLLKNADWGNLLALLGNIGLPLISLIFVILLLSITISTYKWDTILKIHGIHFRFSALHEYYFIGAFFNNFLPTSIGGDGYRIYKTMDNEISRSCAILAVFVERASGLAALILIGSISSIYIIFINGGNEAAHYVLIAGSLSAIACMAGFFIIKYGLQENTKLRGRFGKLIKDNIVYLLDYKRNPKITLRIAIVSLLFHIHNSMAFYLLLKYGVDFDISFAEVYIVLTLTNLISILPISINGIGVVDGAFIYLTGLYGVSYDQSLSVMIVARALLIPLSLIGGFYYLKGENKTTSP